MKMIIAHLVAVVSALSSVSTCLGGSLLFDAQKINVAPGALTQRAIPFSFRYVNTSSYTVTIKDITVSCGCTDISLTQRTVAPRKEGFIRGTIDLAKRIQDTVVTIAVEIEGESAPILLTVMATLGKDVLTVSPPSMIVWRRGEDPQAKTFHLWLSKAGGASLSKLDVSNDHFTAEVIEDKLNEGNYTIRVKPKSTEKKSGAVITPADDSLRLYLARLRFHAYIL